MGDNDINVEVKITTQRLIAKIGRNSAGKMDSSIFILILTLAIQNVVAYSAEYTITVEPGKEDCFFLDVPQNSYLELDYQVIDGQQGELDIDFYIASPSGRRIVMESRKSDSSHRNQITESGDHSICFDNSFSIFSSKTLKYDSVKFSLLSNTIWKFIYSGFCGQSERK